MEEKKPFIPQIEVMDLKELFDKTFIVAVSTGPRDDGRLLAKTIHGPYDFDEMVGEVGRMWSEEQNNAKVYILEKDSKKRSMWLDSDTIDYIQTHFADIVVERILVSQDKTYTCVAGIRSDDEPVKADANANDVPF